MLQGARIVLLLLFLTVANGEMSRSHDKVECTERSLGALRAQWIQMQLTSGADESLSLSTPLRPVAHNMFMWTSRNQVQNGTYGQQDVLSPETWPSSQAPVRVRSLCPWYFVKQIDQHRYPRALMQAKCICDECVGKPDSMCQPILHYIRVLHKNEEISGDICKYIESWEPISVGCTCATNS